MTTAAAEDRERVGPYQIVQAIGAGGSARIDLARIDRAYGFQRHVVVKRPLEHLRGNPQVAASLRREARIGGLLRHPNLVAILDAGTHDGYVYLVLEYVHGASLRALMQTDTPGEVRALPLAVALAIATDVARAMHEAHELTDDSGAPLGLVHRDVSPGNILLGLDGAVKLADFGIAKETRVSTLSGSMHGTVTYMAPEQCQGHAFDRRADVFSLGVILYELVTGARLFWADNDVASLHRVLSGSVPRPRKIKPELPSALEDIVLIAVAHEAEKRYANALELATALELYAAGAGEVLGARWIARTVEDVVGAKLVPWIAPPAVPDSAAPTIPETAMPTIPESAIPTVPDLSARDGSLVELLRVELDEAIEPSFGDAGDAAVAVPDEPAPPPRAAVAPPAPPPRRRRGLLAGIVALGAISGGAGTALVMTHGSKAPATVAPAQVAPSAGDSPGTATQSPAPPPASAMPSASDSRGTATPGTDDSPAPATQNTTPQPDAATPNTPLPPAPATDDDAPAKVPTVRPTAPSATPAAVPSPSVRNKRRKPPAVRNAPRALSPKLGERATVASPPPKPTERATVASPPPTSAPADAPSAGSGSPPPSAAPPAKVEWKPTLLLPTDGSAAKAPR
jgi:serine/threonine protein kinase